jgi:hypothetical protein
MSGFLIPHVRCGNCLAFEKTGKSGDIDVGICHDQSPTVVVIPSQVALRSGAEPKVASSQAPTNEDGWCMQFKPSLEMQQTLAAESGKKPN